MTSDLHPRQGSRAPPSPIPPTLVGGVGYAFLRDFSVGSLVARELQAEEWPAEVCVEDLSYGPVAVIHRLHEADPPFRRLIVTGAVRRGRRPGAVRSYRWDGVLPDVEELQARVSEAVTGVIGLENLVMVPAALGTIPPQVLIVEVEPEVEAPGEEPTPAVRAAADRVKELIRRLARSAEDEVRLPVEPLVPGLTGPGSDGPGWTREGPPSPDPGHRP